MKRVSYTSMRHTGFRLLATTCLTLSIAVPAVAQDQKPAEDDGTGGVLMQDIVVTANKRQEKLQNVGISATAFSGEALTQLGITNTESLTKITPSLNVNWANPSVSQLSIRGVSQNDFADHLEPPVAVYQDEGYVGTSGAASVPVFDMERVEVLRGPQGTLFGRNATGGLIHFISASPTDHLTGYLEGSYGRFNTYNVQGAISGPLGEGIRARIAFTRNKSDGPYTNIVTGKHDVGDTDNWGVRARLSIDLGEATQLDLLGSYNNDDQHGVVWPFRISQFGPDGLGVLLGSNDIGSWPNLALGGTISAPCAGCNLLGYKDADGNPWTVASNNPGYFKRDIYKAQGKLTHNFGNITLTSISDYLQVNKDTLYDTDMSPQSFFVYGSAQHYKQFSQELRLNGDSGALKWVAGLYYLNMRGKYTQPLDLDFGVYVGAPLCVGISCDITADATIPVHFDPHYSVDVDSYAVFAQGEYELSPQFSLTAGLRYTHDKKKFHYDWTDRLPFTAVLTFDDKKTFENVAAKLQLDWRPSDGTLLYLSYTRGHKGGNWAAPAFPPVITAALPHKQEVLTSYETGVKTRLGKIATLNVSGYYYDYSDYQAFSLQGLAQSIFNKDATVIGGEAELRVAPMRGLEISANVALMDSKVKGIVLPSGSVVDRKMPNAAPVQLTGLIRYGWSMLGGEMSLQASGKYMDGHYLTVLNEPANYQKGYGTLDLRAAWQTEDGKFEFSVYGDNVTGTYYNIWALDVAALSEADNVPGQRSSYGARVRYNF